MDLEKLPSDPYTLYDPLKIIAYFHVLVFAHLCTYAIFIWRIISVKYKKASLKVLNMEGSYLNQYRNLNTGGRNYDETEGVTATNRIHHSIKYPSQIRLPVIER